MGRVKTTIEIPDELFKKAKATAAIHGESLKELICDALEIRLASMPKVHGDRSGWRNVFGLAEPKSIQRIDRLINADLERVDPSEWL